MFKTSKSGADRRQTDIWDSKTELAQRAQRDDSVKTEETKKKEKE